MGKRATVIAGSSNFGLILKNWKDVKGAVICDVMPTSCLKGKVFTGDRIILINGINIESVADVTNLPGASEYYIDIVYDDVRFSSTRPKPTHTFTAPAGRIGLELTNNHVVKRVRPDSPLVGKVLANDRLVMVNDLDVRNVSSADLVEILKGNAAYEREIGIERPETPPPKQGDKGKRRKLSDSETKNLPANGEAPKMSCATKKPAAKQKKRNQQEEPLAKRQKQGLQPKELVNQHRPQESATPPQRPAPAERTAAIEQAAPTETSGVSQRATPENSEVPRRTAPQRSTVNQRRSQRVVERLETSKVAAEFESTSAQPVAVMISPPEPPQVAVIPPPPEPEPEPELPYALEDLPEVLRKIKKPKWPYTAGTYCKPGERVPVKKIIIQAYEIHESIVMLESFLPQAQSCNFAHTALSVLIDAQKRQRDAILEFEEKKLNFFERDLRHLVRFKIEHGHLETPSGKNALMGSFVSRWRQHYSKRQNAKEPCAGLLTPSRHDAEQVREENFQLLTDFGFLWKSPKMLVEWDDLLEKLNVFKEEYGHVKVPQLYKDKHGFTLGNWVSSQRKEYEHFNCGEKTPMNPDRIEKLDALGFVWKLRYGRPKRSDPKFRNKRLGVGYGAPNGADKSASAENSDKNNTNHDAADTDMAGLVRASFNSTSENNASNTNGASANTETTGLGRDYPNDNDKGNTLESGLSNTTNYAAADADPAYYVTDNVDVTSTPAGSDGDDLGQADAGKRTANGSGTETDSSV